MKINTLNLIDEIFVEPGIKYGLNIIIKSRRQELRKIFLLFTQPLY